MLLTNLLHDEMKNAFLYQTRLLNTGLYNAVYMLLVGQTVYIDAITIFFFECSLQNIKIIYQEAGIKKIILSEHYFIDRNVRGTYLPI